MIGERIPRREDRRFVTGRGSYTDDISLADQTWACFLRSPHAHARLLRIDTSVASGMPGVLAVLTGQDYLDDGLRGIDHVPNPADAVDHRAKAFTTSATGAVYNRRQLPLPVGAVRHVGEAIAVVIAQTLPQARDAMEAIEVDYEPLAAVIDADVALREGQPQLWDDLPGNCCFRSTFGDEDAVQAAFAKAHLVVRREFRGSRIVNCQMEPRSAIGAYDVATDAYTLTSGSQGVSRQQAGLADAFGVPKERVRVVSPDVGGGFGPRTSLNMEQAVVLWAAKRVGRPVKWTADRSEAFVSDYQGRDMRIRAALALDAQGRIMGLRNEVVGNVGAHTVSYVPMSNGMRVTTSVYDVPAVSVHITAAVTNTVPTAPYRGAGRPETIHALERMLDIAAGQLGIDRIELRRRNLIPRASLPRLSPMGLPYDSGDFSRNMARAVEMADWGGFPARRAASEAAGRLRGIGLANYVESPVGAPHERIELRVLQDGSIELISGTQSTGQGHETTFAQVLASKLGVAVEQVRLRTGDTAFVKSGGGTHSDRSMRLVGTLLVQASTRLMEQARAAAADLLDVQPAKLRYEDGRFEAPGLLRVRKCTWSDLVRHVGEHGLADDRAQRVLQVSAEFTGRMPAFPTGCAVCELEIDPLTGVAALVRYSAVDDVGTPINPLIVEGQVHGGLAQGLGQALCEGFVMDAQGQVLSGSYMDYGMPRAGLMPPLAIEFAHDPTEGNPLGVKGGGESGITPATACVFNALADALRGYTSDELPMPATPLAIWRITQGKPPPVARTSSQATTTRQQEKTP